MELSLNRRSINCFRKTLENTVLCDTSAECVVPDVQEDIRQVLTTSFITKIRSKDIDIEEISIKAELGAVIMYYSEAGIAKLDMTLPLNARIPAKDIDSSCIVNADIKVLSYDVRVINPRKISLSAAVCVKMTCYKENEIIWYECPEELPEKLYVKSENAVIRVVDTVAEKVITAEEEFDLNESSDNKLISANALYHIENTETVGDKLILRGVADIEATYLSDGDLKNQIFSFPFSQLFDVSGDGESDAVILSTGEYYDIAEGKFTAELHAVIQLVHYRNCEICYASDAYSCNYEAELQYEALDFCSGCKKDTLTENIQLSYDSGHNVKDILMTRSYITKLTAHESGVSLAVAAEIIYRDSENEIYCGKVRGNVEFELDSSMEYTDFCYRLSNTRAVPGENSIEFRGEVYLTAKCEKHDTIGNVALINEGEKLLKSSPSAYIVFSDADLWSIAKKYSSDPEKILEIVSDENGVRGAKKLFVPVIK